MVRLRLGVFSFMPKQFHNPIGCYLDLQKKWMSYGIALPARTFPFHNDFIRTHAILASLIEGPLSGTSAYMAKVATSPREETSFDQHVMHIYIPDVYDKDHVTQVSIIGFSFPQVYSSLSDYENTTSKPWIKPIGR